MPLIDLKATQDWMPDLGTPLDEQTLQRQCMGAFANRLPTLVVAVWKKLPAHWGPISELAVVPDYVDPPRIVIPNVTPDLYVLFRPSYTPERYGDGQQARLLLMSAIASVWRALSGDVPQIDCDVRFEWGYGGAMDGDLNTINTWPDPLVSPH